MKLKRFFLVIGLGYGAAGFSTQAAFINLQQNTSSPYYSDFTAVNLDVNYVYSGNSTSGTGVYTVSDSYSSGNLNVAGEHYTSSTDSPGSHGSFNNAAFNGSYSLTADISYNNGVATLTGGTFDIFGNLMGGTTSSLLLQGNLVTGAGGAAFGYEDAGAATLSSGDYNTFQFLVNLSSLTGNSEIVADFLHSMGGTGGIIIDANFDTTGHLSGGKTVYNVNNGSKTTTINQIPPPSSYGGFQGLWDQSFANPLNAGTADTFIPKSAAYPWAASLGALLSCRSFARRTMPFARQTIKI